MCSIARHYPVQRTRRWAGTSHSILQMQNTGKYDAIVSDDNILMCLAYSGASAPAFNLHHHAGGNATEWKCQPRHTTKFPIQSKPRIPLPTYWHHYAGPSCLRCNTDLVRTGGDYLVATSASWAVPCHWQAGRRPFRLTRRRAAPVHHQLGCSIRSTSYGKRCLPWARLLPMPVASGGQHYTNRNCHY